MKDLNFDIYAWVNPQNEEDYLALLREAIRLVKELNETLDAILKLKEK